VNFELLEGDQIHELYSTPGFTHALSYQPDRAVRDVLAVVARDQRQIIGVAAAKAETQKLWQIGVDVIPEARQQGLGKFLVSRLSQEILNRDIVPYYSAASSNIASRSIAASLGFWPAWTELLVNDIT
jgi:predicted GNAT family acetyltransferase